MALEVDPAPSSSGGDADAGNDTGDDGELEELPIWFELMAGYDWDAEWEPLEDGGPLYLEIGPQGLLMFSLSVHAGGFPLPEDPKDPENPELPKADITIDTGDPDLDRIYGHFFQALDYPLIFDVEPDGETYSYYWITVFPPDETLGDLSVLHGVEGTVDVTLRPHGVVPLTQTWDVVLDTESRVELP